MNLSPVGVALPEDPSTPYPVGPTPAQTPPGASYADHENGTEYLTAACWWDTPAGGRQTWVFGTWVDDPGPLPDAAILSHEVAEWFADPFTDNVVPPWHSPLAGPAATYGCQRLLETGDPLVGATRVVDGYHLQDGFRRSDSVQRHTSQLVAVAGPCAPGVTVRRRDPSVS